ncbi:MAG: LCP family protein [Candidatus Dormibacteraeota bacterium]|nr:LCP family protein [Candidatus Dormibacteraeota bacterium]
MQPRRRRASAATTTLPTSRLIGTAVAVIIAAILIGLAFFTVRLWSVLHAISPRAQPQDLVTLVHAQSDEPGSLGWRIKHDERLNILLVGYGGPGHDGPYLTDSLMLLSIKPGSRQAVMISLPRDLWVKIPALPNNGSLTGKLNSAYAIGTDHTAYPNVRSAWKTSTGGGDLAAATVSQITGQHIDYWVGVDFKAFRDVVNALGGVRVAVPTPLDDPSYPLGETASTTHIHFNAGPQQLNGERALEYARSRETTSDFDRSRRQQLILLAVRQRALSLNAVPRLFSLLSALQDNVRTNLRPAEMQQLANLTGQLKEKDIRHVGIDTSNLLRSTVSGDGQYILVPLDPTYATLQRYVAAVLPARAALTEQVQVQVEDGSRRYWLPYGTGTPASIVAGLLQNAGWPATLAPLTGARPAQTVIHDASAGKAPGTLAWLQAYFQAQVVVEAPPPGGPTITVVLGPDFTQRAFPAPGSRIN